MTYAKQEKSDMYAVVKTGGKQYRVAVGDKLKVETIQAEPGDTITLDNVLMIGDGDNIEVGTPTLSSGVEATVLSHGRGKKLRIVKFRRRQNSRTRTGHRQNFTELEITAIGGKSAAKPAAKPKAQKAEKKTEAKAAAGGDDLTKISGVGPVIVGKLNALGITTFQQIADWSEDDVTNFDEQLNFKGRIDRDDWIKQATELAKG